MFLREMGDAVSIVQTHYKTIAASATYTESAELTLSDYGYPQRIILFLAGTLLTNAAVDAKVQDNSSGSYADTTGAAASLSATGVATPVEVELPAGTTKIKVLARSQTANAEVAAGVALGDKKQRDS